MKKQRYYLVFIVAAVLILSAYCAFQVKSSMNILNRADMPPSPVKETEALDLSIPLVTYVNTASGDVLISCIDNGIQLLAGDIGPISLFTDNLPSNLPNMSTLSKYEASNVSDKVPLELSSIRSNGEWDFFPCDIVYTEYDLTSQPENMGWFEFFKNRLAAEGYDGPIIITGSLSFSTNGTDVSIVTASNVIVNNVDIDMDIQSVSEPSNLTPAIYTISVVFIDNQNPTEVFSKYIEIPKNQEDAAWLGTSYNYWSADHSQYTQFISALQYDENSLPKMYPIFCDHGGENCA